MNFLLTIAVMLLLIFAGYLFLIAPDIRKRKLHVPAVFFRPYAHRGLHDGPDHIPENSLPAFQRALEKGYGIEMDVRLTRDGQMVIHHDASLLRMCGKDVKIAALTLEEIRRYRLGSTGEKIPTLEEALDAIAGKTPLIVELKHDRIGDTHLAQMLYARMQSYAGPYCVESFDPMMMRWFKKHAPQVIRGQLAYDPARLGHAEGKKGVIYFLAAHLLCNFLSRPDFVAYGYETDGNPSFRVMRSLFRPYLAAWTVRSLEDFKRLQGQYDWQIFEAFEPYIHHKPQSEKEQST